MANRFLDLATAAMQRLNADWFTPQTPLDWGGGSNFWKTPTISEEIVGYMALAGSQDYVQTVENARQAGEPYIGNAGWYDDATCWGRFFVSAYAFFNGNSGLQPLAQNYLTDAQGVYQDLLGGWDDTCGGGIWWKRSPTNYPDNFKATNATLGLMEIALGLHAATNDQDCLAWAQKCWSWIKQSNLIVGGLVIGGLNARCRPDPANGPVVALQGNPLGPLWSLYAATGDTSCLDVGQEIADATIRQMIWPTVSAWDPQTAILLASTDVEWNAQGEDAHQAWSGQTPFKGIFVGFLGEFAKNLAGVQDDSRRAAAQRYAAVLADNATTVAANFPAGAYGMDWHTPQPNYQPDSDSAINASLQYSALALFAAAAKTNPSS